MAENPDLGSKTTLNWNVSYTYIKVELNSLSTDWWILCIHVPALPTTAGEDIFAASNMTSSISCLDHRPLHYHFWPLPPHIKFADIWSFLKWRRGCCCSCATDDDDDDDDWWTTRLLTMMMMIGGLPTVVCENCGNNSCLCTIALHEYPTLKKKTL